MKVVKNYEWRELSSDGLLKSPPACGPYYDRDENLIYGSWSSEESAINALKEYVERNRDCVSLVLITTINVENS